MASAQVTQIRQDPQGFIWILTRDGVNRFDSESFQLFTKASHGLRYNNYKKLLIDQSGMVWLVKYKGIIDQGIKGIGEVEIDILNPKTGKVNSFDQYFGNQIKESDIFFLKNQEDNTICIGDKKGNAYRFTDQLQHLFALPIAKPMAFFPIQDHHFWVDRGNRFELYDSCVTLLQKEIHPPNVQFFGETKDGTLLFQSSPGKFPIIPDWNIYFLKKGLPLKKNQLTFKDLLSPKNQLDRLQFYLDREQRIWANNLSAEKIFIYELSEKGQYDFSNPSISIDAPFYFRNLYFDKKNLAWFCSMNLKGVALIRLKKNNFTNYLTGQDISTRGILVLENESLFVNSYKGLYIADKKRQFSLPTYYLGLDLIQDNKEQLWSGIHNKEIIKIDPTSKKMQRFLIDPKYFAPEVHLETLTLHQDKNGLLWIGTSAGLYYKKMRSDAILPWTEIKETLLASSIIRHFYEDKEGLWMCTSQGLLQLSLQTGQLIHHNHLPIKDLIYLYESDPGIFWISTFNEGLLKWDRKNDTFKQFTDKEGLVNNTIYAIYPDNHGFLWLPSNKGLMRFNKKREEVITFHSSDGIPHEEFNIFSHHQDKKGNLYFGGLNGITVFHPDSLSMSDHAYMKPQIISYAELSNVSGTLEDFTSDLLRTNKIVLCPEVKAFQLQFASLDFEHLEKQGYAYRLAGFETDWNYVRDNTIRMHSIPYGNYILEVKSQNAKTHKASDVLYISLVVLKPFYKQLWFRVFVFLGSMLLMFAIFRYRIYHLKSTKKRLENEVKMRTLQIEADKIVIARQNEELIALNQTKDRLFGIIGHELRGPFVYFQNIAGKLSYLIKKGDYDRAQKMGVSMDQAATKISGLLDNLLYWGLVQSDRLPYLPIELDVSRICLNLVGLYQDLAEVKGIALINKTTEPAFVFADLQSVQIILRNLLGNALKFTAKGGNVELGFKREEKFLSIYVKDTGIGMTSDQIQSLLDPKSLLTTVGTSGEKGTGLGIQLCRKLIERNSGEFKIESRKGEGSIFIFTLPLVVGIYANVK